MLFEVPQGFFYYFLCDNETKNMDWKLEYYVTICRIQPGKFKKDKKAH